jgi:hypothetical protein
MDLEWIQVDNEKVDLLDAMLLAGFLMLLVAPDREQTAVNL